MPDLLEVKNLKTGFQTENGFLPVVQGISFHVNQGEIVGLVGESGSGKSVTSLSIMRLFHDTSGKVAEGEIIYKGENLLTFSEKKMTKYRGKELSMVFQEPMTALNPVLTIGKQMRETIMLHMRMSKKEAQQYAIEKLKSVGIQRAEQVMKDYPHQLSGGMRQRVIIAMQISCNPSLLIADEPTTALDVTIQAQILKLMEEIQQKTNMGILLITHDLGVVAEICDRVIVMYAGRIVEEASAVELFENPKHPYTKGLMESVPKIGSNKDRLNSIAGTVPNPNNMPKGCKFTPRCPLAMPICHEKEPELMADGNHSARCWLLDEEVKKKEEMLNV
ncbi:ABC transporter ATP-binding protein [Pradoshia sp. D12]|uniref:ABC transporter ATP-binding protein n=1 Tax=Bacillaceae TaxID=186817 RepID=UPI001127D571|nr:MULTISPECIES: ABC transporter ATP-binding protein [Bacillaceae]QFK71959.1 ABC transporter ATP-binding protein [Pradoshia sp. D12]TPF71549.1 ABC transporter ATP-binding protein [Bacillus sp. D12]